ncbi:MAG: hypothetical protein ACR2HE_07295 [Casimicrobiaceae bacterium]
MKRRHYPDVLRWDAGCDEIVLIETGVRKPECLWVPFCEALGLRPPLLTVFHINRSEWSEVMGGRDVVIAKHSWSRVPIQNELLALAPENAVVVEDKIVARHVGFSWRYHATSGPDFLAREFTDEFDVVPQALQHTPHTEDIVTYGVSEQDRLVTEGCAHR